MAEKNKKAAAKPTKQRAKGKKGPTKNVKGAPGISTRKKPPITQQEQKPQVNPPGATAAPTKPLLPPESDTHSVNGLNYQATTRQPDKHSTPYIIAVKNTSLEYIKGFALNNIEQAQRSGSTYNPRVTVTYLVPQIPEPWSEAAPPRILSFFEFLRFLDTKVAVISQAVIESRHLYEKYRNLQVDVVRPVFIESTFTGDASGYSFLPVRRVVQEKETIMLYNVDNFSLRGGWDIKLDLLPEADIILKIYPSKITHIDGKVEIFAKPAHTF